MRSRLIIAVALLTAAATGQADVILPGPPLAPIQLSKAQAAKMKDSAKAAVPAIFDFGNEDRPDYLNAAYREADKHRIVSVEKIVSVRLIGDRAFVLAVTQNWVGPQSIGPAYTYFQCHFDDTGELVRVDII